MIPILLTVLGFWLASSALLGLIVGLVMAGYSVGDAESGAVPAYPRRFGRAA